MDCDDLVSTATWPTLSARGCQSIPAESALMEACCDGDLFESASGSWKAREVALVLWGGEPLGLGWLEPGGGAVQRWPQSPPAQDCPAGVVAVHLCPPVGLLAGVAH
eukprot:373845-Lingulodinium_polyedra.AAC.1